LNEHGEPSVSSELDLAERAFTWLRRAFQSCPVPSSPADWAGKPTAEEREGLQHLQTLAAKGSHADGDIACLLAHSGIDYRLNVRRLLRSQSIDPFGEPGGSNRPACGGSGIGAVSGHVARLYHRRRDAELLDWLLGSRPGPHQRTERSAAILAIWDAHWTDLLAAAGGEPNRCRRITDMVRHALCGCADPLPAQAFQWQLAEAADGSDPEIAPAARVVLDQLGWLDPPATVQSKPAVRPYGATCEATAIAGPAGGAQFAGKPAWHARTQRASHDHHICAGRQSSSHTRRPRSSAKGEHTK